jgi:hypothetical protein
MAVEPVNGPHFFEKIYKENSGKKDKKIEKDPVTNTAGDTARVQISDEAQKLKNLQDKIRIEGLSKEQSGEIDEERLKTIQERIKSGYYEAPEVQDEIAELLIDLFLPGDD